MAATRLIPLCALLAVLIACGNPNPRGYAQPGVASSGDRGIFNAPYYTGADPAFGASVRGPSGRPGGGGSN